MKSAGVNGLNCSRPTHRQELLLRSCLCQGDAALQAFRQWEALLDHQPLDLYSLKLVPLLHQKLIREGIESSRLEEFGALYRVNQIRAIQQRHAFRAIVDVLAANGIPVLALKGIVLGEVYYTDPAVRYQDDFDIMVPITQLGPAVDVMQSQGWKMIFPRPFTEKYLRFRHSTPFRHHEAGELDLHWNLLHEGAATGSAQYFWKQAIPSSIAGIPCQRLSAAHQFFHTVSHGVGMVPMPRMMWVADAMTILSREPDLDWKEVTKLAGLLRVTLRMGAALGYLHEALEADIPATILASLEEAKVGYPERLSHEFRTGLSRGRVPYALIRLNSYWSEIFREDRSRAENLRALIRDIFSLERARFLALFPARVARSLLLRGKHYDPAGADRPQNMTRVFMTGLQPPGQTSGKIGDGFSAKTSTSLGRRAPKENE